MTKISKLLEFYMQAIIQKYMSEVFSAEKTELAEQNLEDSRALVDEYFDQIEKELYVKPEYKLGGFETEGDRITEKEKEQVMRFIREKLR